MKEPTLTHYMIGLIIVCIVSLQFTDDAETVATVLLIFNLAFVVYHLMHEQYDRKNRKKIYPVIHINTIQDRIEEIETKRYNNYHGAIYRELKDVHDTLKRNMTPEQFLKYLELRDRENPITNKFKDNDD